MPVHAVMVYFGVTCLVICRHLSVGATIGDTDSVTVGEPDVIEYLRKYNYLKKSQEGASSKFIDEITLSVALKRLQRIMSITVTGIADNATRDIMERPRCGHPDIASADDTVSFNSSMTYAVLGSKWSHSTVTYRYTSYPRDLDASGIHASIRKAFNMYSAVTPLKFRRIQTGIADIMIQFRELADDSKVLANAYQPGDDYGGYIEFDSSVYWTLGDAKNNGFDFLSVAVHAIGHSLGLGHTSNPRAIMYALYKQRKNVILHADDIQGLTSIYGKAVSPTIVPPPSLTTIKPSLNPEDFFCKFGTFDAISRVHDGQIYAFLGNYYIEFRLGSIPEGYPKLINSRWKEVTTPLHAVVHVTAEIRKHILSNGRYKVVDVPAYTLFFSGDYVWRYEGNKLSANYPDLYTELYKGLPPGIDSAFESAKNHTFYVTKGSTAYKFRGTNLKQTIRRSPHKWYGVPGNVNAAFEYADNYVMFIKGNHYYEFDWRSSSIRSFGPKPLDKLLGISCATHDNGKTSGNLSLFDDGEEGLMYELTDSGQCRLYASCSILGYVLRSLILFLPASQWFLLM